MLRDDGYKRHDPVARRKTLQKIWDRLECLAASASVVGLGFWVYDNGSRGTFGTIVLCVALLIGLLFLLMSIARLRDPRS